MTVERVKDLKNDADKLRDKLRELETIDQIGSMELTLENLEEAKRLGREYARKSAEEGAESLSLSLIHI